MSNFKSSTLSVKLNDIADSAMKEMIGMIGRKVTLGIKLVFFFPAIHISGFEITFYKSRSTLIINLILLPFLLPIFLVDDEFDRKLRYVSVPTLRTTS